MKEQDYRLIRTELLDSMFTSDDMTNRQAFLALCHELEQAWELIAVLTQDREAYLKGKEDGRVEVLGRGPAAPSFSERGPMNEKQVALIEKWLQEVKADRQRPVPREEMTEQERALQHRLHVALEGYLFRSTALVRDRMCDLLLAIAREVQPCQ